MSKLASTVSLTAALSAAVLLGAASPSPVAGHPIVTGHGQWEIPAGTVGFQISLVELPDGSLNGHGLSTLHSASGNAWFHFVVTEYQYVGDELAVAGLIVDTFNTPPNFLGSQTILLVQDNGSGGAPDKAISASGIPPSFSLAQVLSLIPPPPPEFWFPLAGGNFKIH
jgi:hypothetical protein